MLVMRGLARIHALVSRRAETSNTTAVQLTFLAGGLRVPAEMDNNSELVLTV
jgi:hypothetical protein